jgi:ATP-dependent Lon protease
MFLLSGAKTMNNYNLRKRNKSPLHSFFEEKKQKINNEDLESDDEDFENIPTFLKLDDFDFENMKEVGNSSKEIEISSDSERRHLERRHSEESGSNSDEEEGDDKEEGEIIENVEDEDNVDGDYFKLDPTMLKSVLQKQLLDTVPNIDPEILDEALDGALEDANNLISEYSAAKPLDESWKSKLDQEKVDQLDPILKNVRKAIEEEEPTMDNILELINTKKIAIDDAKELVQMYDIYNNLEPYTEVYLRARDDLIKKISEYNKLVVDITQIDIEKKRLEENLPPSSHQTIKHRIIALDTTDEIKGRLLEMHQELCTHPNDSEIYGEVLSKINFALELPYRKMSQTTHLNITSKPEDINQYCTHIRKELDKELYGMDEVKDELICILINKITNPTTIASIGLKGMRGTGKTSIVSALSKAIGKPFERVALGGMNDATQFKGCEPHWRGAGPSVILQIMKRTKTSDPIILLDEIDKIGKTSKGSEVENALLHITDYSQNDEFRDGFINEFPHDISNIWFMYAMNDDQPINPILRDRLHIIDVEPYSRNDLRQIIKGYVLPKALKNVNIEPSLVSIDDTGCTGLMDIFCDDMKENGVRTIQKAVGTLTTRINFLRMNMLPDGTFGNIKVKFEIPRKFKLPLVVNREFVNKIMTKPKVKHLSYFT